MEEITLKEAMMDIYLYLVFYEETGVSADKSTMHSMLNTVLNAYNKEQGF